MAQLMDWVKKQIVWLLEIVAILHYISMFMGCNFAGIPVLLYIFTTPLFVLPLIYLLWMYVDRLTPFRAGRRFDFTRNLSVWKYMVSYFPIRLHKTAELDPTKNYMFCFHPHGILGFSCVVNFASEATDFSKKFPGITIHPLTLDINFQFPLYREHIMACGMGSVRKDSIQHKLTKLGQGHSVCIVTGGAAEAQMADPENPYIVKLVGRRGFVREALMAGAALVPVFSFGESEIFHIHHPKSGSRLDRFQKCVYRLIGFIPIVFYGPLPFFPYRKPLDTVVGSPLTLPRIESPTNEDVELWQNRYIDLLKELFNQQKEKYGTPGKELQIC